MKARGRIPVKFYQIAMLFILFDLEIVFLWPWAVVLTDLVMDELSGVELIRAARSICPSIACVVMTGNATLDSAVRSMQLIADTRGSMLNLEASELPLLDADPQRVEEAAINLIEKLAHT